MIADISSIDMAPGYFLPLMKKVGVEFDAEFLRAAVADGADLVEQLLVREACLERLLREAGELGDLQQRDFASSTATQFGCCLNSTSTIGKIIVVRAAGEHEPGLGARIEGKLAQDQLDLAGDRYTSS